MMTINYIVKSDRQQTVTGLGVFNKDEEKVLGEDAGRSFLLITGLPLNQGNVPEGVEVTVNVFKEEE